MRDIEATYVVDGQDGRLAWGRSSSTAADTKEPFAWAISSDNKTILGADVDGYFRIVLVSPDRMEKCYTQDGSGPDSFDRCRVLHDGQIEAVRTRPPTINSVFVPSPACGSGRGVIPRHGLAARAPSPTLPRKRERE